MWSVVVVAKDMWEVTEVFLKSIQDTTSQDMELIYIDNGSIGRYTWELVGSWAYGSRFKPVVMQRFFPGVGLAKAWNEGIALSHGDLILVCNNDLKFKRSGWLDVFEDSLAQGSDIVGLNGMSWADTPFVQGSLFGFSRNTYSNVGPFDENFEFTCEDVDWCKRATQIGFKIKSHEALKDEYVVHVDGATRRQQPDQMRMEAHLARVRFCYKWKIFPVRIDD